MAQATRTFGPYPRPSRSKVVLRRPGLQSVQAVAAFAETDAEGRFRFEGFLPAVMDLLVRPGDVPSLEVRLERH